MYTVISRKEKVEKVHATILKGIVSGFAFTQDKSFKEIWKNGTRGHGRMFASAKGKKQK